EALEPMSLGELDRGFDGHLAGATQRLDRLRAAQVRAGEDGRDWQRLEHRHQLIRLLLPLLAQRAKAIVARPVAAAAGLRVPDDVEGAQPLPAGRRRHPVAELLAVE